MVTLYFGSFGFSCSFFLGRIFVLIGGYGKFSRLERIGLGFFWGFSGGCLSFGLREGGSFDRFLRSFIFFV